MKQFLLFTLSLIGFTCQEVTKPIEKVCKNVQALDEEVFQELQKPGPLDKNVLFQKMKSYIGAIDELFECVNTDKEGMYEVAKDIIDKKCASFVLDLPWNYFIARTDYGWDKNVLDEFLQHRLEVQEAWLRITKLYDPTAELM